MVHPDPGDTLSRNYGHPELLPFPSIHLEPDYHRSRFSIGRDARKVSSMAPLLSHDRLPDATEYIRILRLFSGHGDIEAELIACKRILTPPYSAISYMWGNELDKLTITINGALVHVPGNSHRALWQARLHHGAIHVWMDTICIKQNDLLEKGTQIAMMGAIYRDAEQVLACVGELKMVEDSSSFMHPELFRLPVDSGLLESNVLCTSLCEEIRSLELHLRKVAEEDEEVDFHDHRQAIEDLWMVVPHCQAWVNELDEIRARFLRHALYSFSQLAYWSRLWILQEIAASAGKLTVFLGTEQVSFLQIHLVLLLLGDSPGPEARSIPPYGLLPDSK